MRTEAAAVTVLSENSWIEGRARKKRQYEGLLALTQSMGLEAYVHVITVGAQWFLPPSTIEALADLGIRPAARRNLCVRMARIAKKASVDILWRRRKLEAGMPDALIVSGYARYFLHDKTKGNSGTFWI